MNRTCYRSSLLSLAMFGMFIAFIGPAQAIGGENADQVPVKNTVTMVDLGGDNCLPCRLMAPVIVELKKAYKGKAAIIYIDVYHDRTAAKKFKAMIIPTQIFYDRNGREVERNEGFMEKAAASKVLNELLAKKD